MKNIYDSQKGMRWNGVNTNNNSVCWGHTSQET